jgi:hypothetical protein
MHDDLGAENRPPPEDAPPKARPTLRSIVGETAKLSLTVAAMVTINAIQIIVASTIAVGMIIAEQSGGYGIGALFLTLLLGPVVGAVAVAISLKTLIFPLWFESLLSLHPAWLGALLGICLGGLALSLCLY